MGIETLLFVGLSAISGIANMSAAQKQAKADVAEGNIAGNNLAKKIRYQAADQRVSFLNSGLTLDGTPMDVINDTFDTGLQDLNQLASSTNAKSKNTIAKARSDALTGIAGSFVSAGKIGSGINSATGGWTSSVGLTGGLDPSTGINWDSGRNIGSFF